MAALSSTSGQERWRGDGGVPGRGAARRGEYLEPKRLLKVALTTGISFPLISSREVMSRGDARR